MEHTAIVWFRNDLRLHDNEALTEAIQKAQRILPVYVFDTRIFQGKTPFGFNKTENFRTKFIIESVIDLRENLRSKGSDLIIRVGLPEEEVFTLAKRVKSSWVYCNRERTSEEVKVQDTLEKNLWKIGQELRYTRGKMLLHTADLPFPVCQVPDVFTNFRKEVEGITPIRQPLDTPNVIPNIVFDKDRGVVPALADFGKSEVICSHIENQKMIGGERQAISQLNYYLFEFRLIDNYKETRNALLGWDFSSKLSVWLSTGCVSPKYVYHKIKEYEQQWGKNDSTYWLYFELLWRDFFRLMGKKYECKIFQQEGMREADISGNTDFLLFNNWKNGTTGVPLIDANMRQLMATGFMSNRGRQNVASFLVKDLNVNWVMGAEYFESMLIDYDPCSNYCNWNYIAGVGNDPREDRYFNILSQSKRYDPHGDFLRYWVPELRDLPDAYIHQPEMMDIGLQVKYNVIIGKNYPNAIINTSKWIS
ncbi:MAG: DASH family cryptochrome [Saprospiraceae bacterium]|nr:DASH family cryptochrome [Saprospiraceae bacterium]